MSTAISAVPMTTIDYSTGPQTSQPQTTSSRLPEQSFVQNSSEQKKEHSLLHALTENVWFKSHLPEALNVLSISSNGAAAVANMFNFSNGVRDFANSFGKFGAKTFLIINGAINAIEYFCKGNFLGALGHFNDIIVGSTVPHDHLYLDRGTASGTYTLANSLAIINNRDKFTSFGDHLSHIVEGFKKSYQNFFSKDFFKNLANANNGMFGVASGIFCNLGVLTWFLTNNEKLGTAIRDFGGILMDIEQAHLGHLKMGRKYYFMSGLGLLGGTVSDFLAKMLPYYKKVFVPLSLCIDGIGRYLLRISHNRNELSQTKAESKPELKEPVVQPDSMPAIEKTPLTRREAASSLAQMPA